MAARWQITARCAGMILAATLISCRPTPPAPAGEEAFSFSLPRKAWVHLTPGLRESVDQVMGDGSRDLLIVLHSTGTAAVSVAALDDYYRRVKGEPEGMPYHVLIGNGRGLEAGEVYFSGRFSGVEQGKGESVTGGMTLHVALVDRGEKEPPGRTQLEALDELLDYLAAKTPHLRVRLHREVEPSSRGCPGEGFPLRALRAAFSE